jgi:hypothetical protein
MNRVLVAVDTLMYREVIAHAVREHRPRAEVLTADPGLLDSDETTRCLAPHLVVCNRATRAVREVAVSWVELEVRLGPVGLDANMKVDGRPLSRMEQAEIGDVLAAPWTRRRGRCGGGPSRRPAAGLLPGGLLYGDPVLVERLPRPARPRAGARDPQNGS